MDDNVCHQVRNHHLEGVDINSYNTEHQDIRVALGIMVEN